LPKHKIDGLDVWPLIRGSRGANNPHDGYYGYYEVNQLQSVVTGDGRWKLQLPHTYNTLNGRPGGRDGKPAQYDRVKLQQPELYDLESDIGEAMDVSSANPKILAKMLDLAEQARAELGDSLTNRKGSGTRQPGKVTTAVAKLPPGRRDDDAEWPPAFRR
jgi:hypothetical protein